MTIFHASDFLGLHCRIATGKATTAGQDNDTSRKSWAEAQGWDPMDPIRCRASDESKAHGGEVK